MKKIPVSHLISLIIIGISFGWLIGMSASPVMHIVVTSLVALVVSLITILSGLEKKEADAEVNSEKKDMHNHLLNRSINPVPIMLMMLGIVLGSMSGVWTRTHALLGEHEESAKTLKEQVEEWESAGMNRQDVVYGLFSKETGISMSFENNSSNEEKGNDSAAENAASSMAVKTVIEAPKTDPKTASNNSSTNPASNPTVTPHPYHEPSLFQRGPDDNKDRFAPRVKVMTNKENK